MSVWLTGSHISQTKQNGDICGSRELCLALAEDLLACHAGLIAARTGLLLLRCQLQHPGAAFDSKLPSLPRRGITGR